MRVVGRARSNAAKVALVVLLGDEDVLVVVPCTHPCRATQNREGREGAEVQGIEKQDEGGVSAEGALLCVQHGRFYNVGFHT